MSTIPAEQVPLWAPLYGAPPVLAVKRVFQKYATFSGRASRSEYWWWALVNGLVYLVLYVPLIVALGVAGSISQNGGSAGGLYAVDAVLGILLFVWFAGTIVPNIALIARRVHDSNNSALLVLLGLIPYVGGLILFIFALLPSNPLGRRFDAPNGQPVWQSGMPYGAFPPAPGEPERPMPPLPGAYAAPAAYPPPQGYGDPQAYSPQGYGQPAPGQQAVPPAAPQHPQQSAAPQWQSPVAPPSAVTPPPGETPQHGHHTPPPPPPV